VSLCETLDRVLNRGAVIAGDLVISVADVDLVYVGLNLVVASVETMRGAKDDTSRRDRRRG
jgi:gas vesicle structural protein